jgi:flagellar hook protein FlgE
MGRLVVGLVLGGCIWATGAAARDLSAEELVSAARHKPAPDAVLVATPDLNDPQPVQAADAADSDAWPQGGLRVTHDALQFAILGDGFFWLIDPQSGRLHVTRHGAFEVDIRGYLVHWEKGDHVMQKTATGFADIRITNFATTKADGTGAVSHLDRFMTTNDGRLYALYADSSRRLVATLAIASFAYPRRLKRVGQTLFEATEAASGPWINANSKIFAYSLEEPVAFR